MRNGKTKRCKWVQTQPAPRASSIDISQKNIKCNADRMQMLPSQGFRNVMYSAAVWDSGHAGRSTSSFKKAMSSNQTASFHNAQRMLLIFSPFIYSSHVSRFLNDKWCSHLQLNKARGTAYRDTTG